MIDHDRSRHRGTVQCLEPHYEVSSAFDAHEGLADARQTAPALIVLDVRLPEPSCAELLSQLRELPHAPALLLACSADREEAALELLEHGAGDFIVEPFTGRALVARVAQLLAARRTREELASLRDAAEGASVAKEEFLAMLGHELRNPLSPILTALEVMKLRGVSGSELERSVIERQVSHLTRLIDDLLDVSRLARGKVELKLVPVQLGDVVARAIDMASPLLEQRAHSLTVEVPPGLQVMGDAARLGQVVSNLLTNAAKYTPRGGSVSIRAQRDEDAVVLTVSDSGMGIAPEMLPRIFDLFVQSRQELDRSQGGLGIGLSLVRNLVEGHGGSVGARSRGPGRGSEFTVRLPALTARAPALVDAPVVAVPAAAAGADVGSRILVVDDNQDGADMLAEILTGKGYDTRVAHDAPTALRVAASFSPEVAFLDIGLPVMDGYELAGHLRRLPGLAGLQLIALTGYGQESDRQKAREAGFHHHLIKPVDIAVIEETLTRHGASRPG